MSNKLVRIAPSKWKRALHSLLLQYIEFCRVHSDLLQEGHTPYMDLRGKKCSFGSSAVDKTNLWDTYFIQPQPVDDIFWVEMVSPHFDYCIKLYGEDLNSINNLKTIVDKFIIIKEDILKEADTLYRKYFSDNTVGIHIRATDNFFDKGRPIVPLSYFEKLIEAKLDGYDKIFIGTDNENVLSRLQSRFADRIIYQPATRTDICFHHSALHENDNILTDTGREALIDSILFSKCKMLIRQHSNVTTFSKILNPALRIHQVDLPFWQPYNFQVPYDKKEIAFNTFYDSNLILDDEQIYVENYIELGKKLKTQMNSSTVHQYTEENKALLKDYFYRT